MSLKGSITKSDYIEFQVAKERAIEIASTHPVMAGIILTGIYTGLRISDILSLRATDLEENDVLVLRETKTGKPRSVLVNQSLKNLLKQIDLPKQGYMFSNDGTKPFTRQYINRMLKDIFCDLDCNISTHSLRKTFGRKVMDVHGHSSQALMKLCEIFNHSSPATTRIYLGLRQEELNEMYSSLP